jgi:uroporphyrinogen-III synthase
VTAILVTRPAGAGDQLVAELATRGYRVIAVPTVLARPVEVDWPPLEGFDWIVLTSAAGVKALPSTPSGPRWAAVGQSTAKALRRRGVEADLIPAESNGATLGEALPHPKGARVLLVRASLADPDLPATLRRRGAQVAEVTAYQTIEGPDESREELRRALSEPDLVAVVFASGSAVRGFVKLGGTTDLLAITIGPRTSAVARLTGFRVAAEAAVPDVHALADAIERAIPTKVGNDA